jgi:hypothetical protein
MRYLITVHVGATVGLDQYVLADDQTRRCSKGWTKF